MPNSKTLPQVEFPTLDSYNNDPTSVFDAHFKVFFNTKNKKHPKERVFGKSVHYTDKIKFSYGSVHRVLRIGLHNIPDERLAQGMLGSLHQHGKIVRWVQSEQMRGIFSPSTWQSWITGIKFSTQPESKKIWDVLSSSSDHFRPNFWTKLIENKD